MRRHGWQLPYHPLQVVAIVLLVSLAFAFYVFFVPFMGDRTLKLLGICIYSPLHTKGVLRLNVGMQMAAVFGLYICCAATDPADPAVLRPLQHLDSSPIRTTTSSTHNDSSMKPPTSSVIDRQEKESGTGWWRSGCIVCMCKSRAGAAPSGEERLYCTLCEVEILKCSKHCRVCGKCVDKFDHHCRWLNNCIGRKNYKMFICLMVSGLMLLILQWVVGVWVTARCFVNRSHFQDDITSKLGSSFSVVPFLCVVVVCTVLAVAATVPLVKLCLFHALLIYKGITTYDYILAIRELDQQVNTHEIIPSSYASPESSVATVLSGASSGSLYHKAWCTPPHLFVDHEQAFVQHDKSQDCVFEDGRKSSMEELSPRKAAVKISPWTLARLNAKDALQAAAKAKENSSTLKRIEASLASEVDMIVETDSKGKRTSREKINARITTDLVCHGRSKSEVKQHKSGALMDANQLLIGGDNEGYNGKSSLTSLQVEALNAFCEDGCNMGSTSSSDSDGDSLKVCRLCGSHRGSSPNEAPVLVGRDGIPRLAPLRSSSDGYKASGGESADDSTWVALGGVCQESKTI